MRKKLIYKYIITRYPIPQPFSKFGINGIICINIDLFNINNRGRALNERHI